MNKNNIGEKIAACFVGQLSWEMAGNLEREDEKKGMTENIQRGFPFRASLRNIRALID